MNEQQTKDILTQDHAHLISSIWKAMGSENRTTLVMTAHEQLQDRIKDMKAKGVEITSAATFTHVVETGWALGFHQCMMMMEDGLLVAIGKVQKETGSEQGQN